MSTFKKANHSANQRGMNQVMSPPSKSTVKKVGITPPISKPSPSTSQNIGVTPPKSGGKMTGKKRVRQAEEATSPSTDSSNGGM